MEILPEIIKKKFISRFKIDSSTGCWEWVGARQTNGYGRLEYNKKVVKSHRISAAIYLGFNLNPDIPIIHSCDNSSCVNPNHLSIGTHSKNLKDAYDRGRRTPLNRDTTLGSLL